mmetsp:Transcript_112643/g.359844  ORF Transcript_112643/g.359844 Transcript_112643/m.359844 type:complete len:228 (+) Transcript_112643:313-996(+)
MPTATSCATRPSTPGPSRSAPDAARTSSTGATASPLRTPTAPSRGSGGSPWNASARRSCEGATWRCWPSATSRRATLLGWPPVWLQAWGCRQAWTCYQRRRRRPCRPARRFGTWTVRTRTTRTTPFCSAYSSRRAWRRRRPGWFCPRFCPPSSLTSCERSSSSATLSAWALASACPSTTWLRRCRPSTPRTTPAAGSSPSSRSTLPGSRTGSPRRSSRPASQGSSRS